MLALALTLLAPSAHAVERDGHPLGLGVMLGQPTGLSGKVYLDRRAQAIDFAVASTYWSGVYGHGTYLWHPSVIASGTNVDLEWHLGVGGWVWADRVIRGGPPPYYAGDRDVAAGIRLPIGLDLNLHDPRFQFFGDVALVGNFVVDPRPGIDAAVGARYYF